MADAADSKSAGETRGSSNLPFGTDSDDDRADPLPHPGG